MNFSIGVDCEGVACAVGVPGGVLNDSKNFEWVRGQATREANAAAVALFESGARRVIVWDNHGASNWLHHEQLDRRCEIAMGVGFAHRWPGLDSNFAGVLLVGYHAMDGTAGGVMAHSFSSKSIQAIRVNGQEVGEMAVDAAVAGELGVPVMFVASDRAGCDEARRFLPWVETVATKQGFGWNAAISKHPLAVADEISAAVRRAVGRLGEMKPFAFRSPMELEIRYKRMDEAQAACARPAGGWTRKDAFTVARTLQKITDYY